VMITASIVIDHDCINILSRDRRVCFTAHFPISIPVDKSSETLRYDGTCFFFTLLLH
jgi:hypothetical protein